MSNSSFYEFMKNNGNIELENLIPGTFLEVGGIACLVISSDIKDKVRVLYLDTLFTFELDAYILATSAKELKVVNKLKLDYK